MLELTEYSKLTPMRLVYPPVSNQEAEWLAQIPEVEERWRQSDFYMIAGRAEARFTNFCFDAENGVMSLDLQVGESGPSRGALKIAELGGVNELGDANIRIETGDKVIRVFLAEQDPKKDEPLTWFTTERLLYDKGRNHPGIYGFANYLEHTTYDLLYVGIAKKGDTYDRLVAKGHKARQSILSNEPQRYPGARPTDEIFLFFFRPESLFLTAFGIDHDFSETDFSEPPVDTKSIVADAEKAFVSLLKPDYNHVQYKSYPKGTDGLYGSKIQRYGYLIGENISFRTAHGEIVGGWNYALDMISNRADALFVEGDDVSFFKSGVDFPSDDPDFGPG